jgi:dipeptidyl aminopeptidase/acylaminoacyl peptidase
MAGRGAARRQNRQKGRGMTDGTAGLTAELVVDGATVQQPVISPDGRWVAYTVLPVGQKTERRLAAIWLAAVDASVPPRPLTPGTAADSAPHWAADSGSVFFLSGVPAQLHRVRLGGGGEGAGPGAGPEVLTGWDGGISAACPLADGASVAVLAADEPTTGDKRRKAQRDDAVVWPERVPPDRLRLLDLATGEMAVVGGLGDRHVAGLVQRPDGGPLAVISWPSPDIDPGYLQSELHVVDPVAGTVLDLGRAEMVAGSPVWWQAADGWHLCYLGEPGPLGGTAVFDLAVPPAGAAAAPARNLTEGMTVCPAGLAQAGGGPPLALFADGLDTGIYRLDPGTRRFGCLAVRTGRAQALTASRSGELIAAVVSTAHEPDDVHAGPPAGPLRRLSDTRPELRRVRWGTQERLSYSAADGLELDGLLVLPAGRSRADGPFPLVTWVHGGPYARWSDGLVLHPHAPAQWLAAAGYAVFLPNPRGGAGHGHDFARAVAGALGGGEFTDILAGIDLLIGEGVADPGRLGIGGGSHGGFMAAWAVGQTGRFRAALMAAGVSHWGMLVASGENGTMEAQLGGSCGWEGPGPHPHDRVSPVSFASRVSTPVLIVHGEQDTNVPLSQAVYFHRALSHYGAEHEFVVYPREGHGYVERAHQIDLLHRTRAWFDRWLLGG